MSPELWGAVGTLVALIVSGVGLLVSRALKRAQEAPQFAPGSAATVGGYPPPPEPRGRLQSAPETTGGWQSYAPHNPPPPLPSVAQVTSPIDRATNQALLESMRPIMREVVTATVDRIESKVEKKLDRFESRLDGLADDVTELKVLVASRLSRPE